MKLLIGKGNVYKWQFESGNPTAHAAWRAFHDHAETQHKAVRHNQPWNPELMTGTLSSNFQNQDSFMYRSQNNLKSLLLDDDNGYCHTTLNMGYSLDGANSHDSVGVDNLNDPYCDLNKPSNSLSLYFTET